MFDVRNFWDALPYLMQGLHMTIFVVVASLLIGMAIGALACAGRLLGHGPLYYLSIFYVGLFRGLPETVLIFWMYFCGPLILNVKLSAVGSAIATLAIISGASLAEIYRAGIEAVPRGQVEAGRSLGLSSWWIGCSVVAPQAIRIMLPAFFGFVTILIKNSALVSAIGVGEIFYQASVYAGQTLRYFEVLTAVGAVYFLIIFPLSMLSQSAERRLAAYTR